MEICSQVKNLSDLILPQIGKLKFAFVLSYVKLKKKEVFLYTSL